MEPTPAPLTRIADGHPCAGRVPDLQPARGSLPHQDADIGVDAERFLAPYQIHSADALEVSFPFAVNGSLWSLPYEIRCYVVLALASLLPGSLRLKVSVAAAGLLVLLLVRPAVPPATPFDKFLGLDYYHTKLGLLFALGAVFACWRERFQPMLWPALAMLVAVVWVPHGVAQLLLFVLGLGTLTLWLALKGRWLPRIPPRMGDWSYGAYLYGFPVQQVLAHFKLHEASFAGYVLACTAITFALAGLSWHLVEKQALRFK